MSDLDEIRAWAAQADPLALETSAIRSLLTIIDAALPLLVAARNFVEGDGVGDKDALEALVEASEKMPWAVLDVLGIGDEDD